MILTVIKITVQKKIKKNIKKLNLDKISFLNKKNKLIIKGKFDTRNSVYRHVFLNK